MPDPYGGSMTGQVGPAMPLTMPQRLRAIFGGSIGNLIEWYDFYVYNAFALYFAKQFAAPTSTATQQFVSVFAIYAVGFLIRPIGGYFLGTLADVKGRKAALTLSVTLMCAGSLIIAALPGYAQIGVAAPLLLLFARLLQGFSLGGEYASSATYLSEVATSRHRGFYSSFQYVTLIGGQVLGSLTLLVMQSILTGPELEAWGWRIPFVLGAVCALFGLYLRRHLVETAEFTAAARTRTRSPFSELLNHKREFFLVLGLTMGGTTAFYTYSTYMPTFLVNTVKLSRDQATLISFITLLLYACMQPLFGYVSDLIGRRPVLMWFGILGTLCTVPLLTTLSHTHDFMTALLLILAALAIVSGYTSINGGGEGRIVSGQRACPGCRIALCDRRLLVRRHGALCGAPAEGLGYGVGVLLVCDGTDLHLVGGLRDDARHQANVAHPVDITRRRSEAPAQAP